MDETMMFYVEPVVVVPENPIGTWINATVVSAE
jgi:hypothetical protein